MEVDVRRPARVLIVDQDADSHRRVSRLLEQADYSMREVAHVAQLSPRLGAHDPRRHPPGGDWPWRGESGKCGSDDLRRAEK
jgi:hypothetical protein